MHGPCAHSMHALHDYATMLLLLLIQACMLRLKRSQAEDIRTHSVPPVSGFDWERPNQSIPAKSEEELTIIISKPALHSAERLPH